MSNKRRLEDTVRIPALVEEFRAAKSSVDPDVASKRAKLLEVEINSLTPDMEARFEFFMRSHFDSRVVKRVLQKEIDCATTDLNHSKHPGQEHISFTTGSSTRGGRVEDGGRPAGPVVSDDMAIVVCGLTKLYVGELVSMATEVMMERLSARSTEDTGPASDFNSFGLLEAAEEVGTVYDVSAFTFVSTLGANYTNGVLSLTTADIEEAARRMGDNNMHGKPAARPHPLFSHLDPVAYRHSSNSLLMPGGSALGGIGVNYGELGGEEDQEEKEEEEEDKKEEEKGEDVNEVAGAGESSRGSRSRKSRGSKSNNDRDHEKGKGRGSGRGRWSGKVDDGEDEGSVEDDDEQAVEKEEDVDEEEEDQIEAPPDITTLREVQGDIVASERAFDALDQENLQFLVRHFNEGVHARESELEDLLKKYVKSQEELISKREKAEAEHKALALAQAQSAALAAAASAENRSAAGALTALSRP